MPAPALRTPLRTTGARILDVDGKPVKLASVGVVGFPLFWGQWRKGHTLHSMLAAVKRFGFNSIRLPISSQLFVDRNLLDQNNGEIRNNIKVNHPELAERTPIEMLDLFIAEAGKRGLGVILDLHKNKQGDWQADLWYQTAMDNPNETKGTVFVDFNHSGNRWTDETNEPTVIEIWKALARRYRDNRTVIGYDLFNEPHGRATWGDGGPTDWRRAAKRVAEEIQRIDASKLIIVEGIGPDAEDRPVPAGRQRVGAAWWGENLNRAGELPVDLPNVVYSPHDYGPYVWCNWWLDYPSAMRELWERLWGYLARNDIAPVWVGEFGQPNFSPQDPGGQQVRQLLDYLHEIGGHFSYWALHQGSSGDTGGFALLTCRGGLEPIPEKPEVLSHYLQPPDATFGKGCPVLLNGYEPKYDPFDTRDTSAAPGFPPAPRNRDRVQLERPTVVAGPDPAFDGCAA